MPPEEGLYTREQRDNTLAGLSIIREAYEGGVPYAGIDGLREVLAIAQRWNEPTDADALARMVAGLSNAAALLLGWIEEEAKHRRELIEWIRQRHKDFDETEDLEYVPDPSWATWDGVLRAIEKTVRDSPISD